VRADAAAPQAERGDLAVTGQVLSSAIAPSPLAADIVMASDSQAAVSEM
jgi:hypothetical protein